MPNPFANVISVEIKERDVTSPEIVELTLRVPEQFITEKYMLADYVEAVRSEHGISIGDLTEVARDNIYHDIEVYGPDGQQLPLW